MAALSDEDIEHFIEHGYLIVKGCFTEDTSRDWIDDGWDRLGVDRHDPSQWQEKRVHLSSHRRVDAREFAPRAWDAAMQLIGGTDRAELPWQWSNAFIANLGVGDDRPWDPPSAAVTGWHKDGDFFRHFLDSPEQGLLTIVLWTDMHHRGGGTFVATDSIGVVARYLAEHGEGVRPNDFGDAELIGRCERFVEMTGEAGDVVLMHPYMLHATSQNVIGHGRLITNPPITLREPMRFDRRRPDDHSPVERAVLRGLDVDRFSFRASGERERLVPDRIRQQQARDAARR